MVKDNKVNNQRFIYPEQDDENITSKIYQKREFHYHKIPKRDKLKNYEEIQKYRDEVCKNKYKPRPQQAIGSNLMNPNTPVNGLLVMHGTGTGKTCVAIGIAEQFKEQVLKYNTKIYVVVPGPNTRENFKGELLYCTGDTYLKNKDSQRQLRADEIERENKIGIYSALQYYKILSYKTFYKKILGEKIVEKKVEGTKIKSTPKKNLEGEIERELVLDRINNMDNTILIIDEAHSLTNNEYGEALKKIIKQSQNLKVILLTATPMKNLADDIIDLLNFIRPPDDQIKREKVFSSNENVHLINFKEGGEEYLKKMASGYISYYRGSIPYTFAEKIDKGEIPEGLLFTPLVRCLMEPFQLKAYDITSKNVDDTLNKSSSAASNFVFPGLDSNNNLVGLYSTDGLNKLLLTLSSNKDLLMKNINKKLFNGKLTKQEEMNFIIPTESKNISGLILNLKYLRVFSIKFYKCINRLSKLTDDNKGSGTAFIYSNLVKAGGMELFAECLKENGYLEYQEDTTLYDIKDNTLDYKTGKTFKEMQKSKKINEFKPATFMVITGGTDDSGEDIPEIKMKIIKQVFNKSTNKNGQNLKFILGSKVMTEGITLENVKEVHILDVHYNLGKVDQVIGRAIRMCKHQAVIDEKNKFPEVNVYRYVASLNKKLSTDEVLYQKAELKYLLVKKVERILKTVAVDCPLLLHNNKFPEEIEKYKNCVPPTLENVKKGKKICPALCDFQECDLKCENKDLNKNYYDNKKQDYKDLTKKELDYSSFDNNMALIEINNLKSQIKDLFRFKHIYNYNKIYQKVVNSLTPYQKELFEEKFLFKALNDLSPKNENDFNNFYDTIFDKYSRPGYLIKREDYFIFQPFDQNEDAPIYYRNKMNINYENQIPLENYVKTNPLYSKKKDKIESKSSDDDSVSSDVKTKKEKGYNFEETMNYYMEREDNFIVGIIDKNLNKLASEEDDLFKIRPPRAKVLEKKRGTGIPTLTGAVCSTSKSKPYLLKLFEQLPNVKKEEIDKLKKSTREDVCSFIKDKLMYLEKYSTSASKNKITYLMVPIDHPKLKFPLNLEDRIDYLIKKLETLFSVSPNSLKKKSDSFSKKLNLNIKESKDGTFNEIKNLPKFTMTINNVNEIREIITNELNKEGFTYDKKKNEWSIIVG